MDVVDRSVGCLLGLASGDALGRPVSGRPSRAIRARYGHLTEMRGNGVHGRPAGTTTADTALALTAARSLLERRGFDAADLVDRFVAWYGDEPVATGPTTAEVLSRLADGEAAGEAAETVFASRSDREATGDGCLARCVPYAVAYRDRTERLAAVTAEAAALTHADPRCVSAAVALAVVVAALLDGHDPEAALGAARDVAAARSAPGDVRTTLSVATDRSVARPDTGGDAVDTLETALHDALTAETVEEAVVAAVNRGGDAATVGAVTGAVAGARFGAEAVPDRWLDALAVDAESRDLGRRLADLDPD